MSRATFRCYYATQPGSRPDCQLTAAAQVGTVPLCPSCLARRSTLGKGQPVRPLPAAPPTNPLELIVDAAQQLHTAERTLHAAVIPARQHGQSWTAIGDTLQITRQAAQQRFREAATT
jgi:hypothetical protein